MGPLKLAGEAVYADGRPFRGRLEAWQTPFHRYVSTGGDGRFLVTGLRTGTLSLTFRIPGEFRSSGPVVRLPREGELRVVVDEGVGTATGRVVVASDGTPIAGARVVVRTPTEKHGDLDCAVRTDASGRFRLPCHPRWARLQVTATGYWSCRFAEIAPGDDLEICLEPSARLAGRVLRADTKEALPGVPVFIVPTDRIPRSGPVRGARVLSDASGRFSFTDVPALEVMVYVHGRGWCSPDLARAKPDGTNPLNHRLGVAGREEIVVLAEPAFRVSGRVRDERGEPLRGVRVVAATNAPREKLSFDIHSTSTDADGRYVLPDLVPGMNHVVRASEASRLRDAPARRCTGESGGSLDLDFVLPPYRAVDVVVRDSATGDPVPDVSIRLEPTRDGSRGRNLRWRTDERGQARLSPVPIESARLFVRHPNYPSPATATRLDARLSGEPVLIRLERGVDISGRVLRPDGGPAWRCSINHGGRSGRTDLDGRFDLIGVAPGARRLGVQGRIAGRYFSQSFPIVHGPEPVEIRLEEPSPEPGPEVLVVRVVDPGGRPVPGAELGVIASDRGGEEQWSLTTRVQAGREEVELDGTEGDLRLEVSGAVSQTGVPLPLGAVQVGPLSPGIGSVTVRLPPERTISGRVLGPDGEGMANLYVGAGPAEEFAEYLGGDGADTRTDREGRFRLGGLRDAVYELHVSGPPGIRMAIAPVVRAGREDVGVRMARIRAAAVTVLDPAGEPVSGAEVLAFLLTGDRSRDWSDDEARSGRNGVATLDHLAGSGTYRLHVMPPVDHDAAETVLESWSPGETTLRLRPGLTVSGRLASGADDADAEIWVRVPGGFWREVDLEEDGSFRARRLPRGPVTLVAVRDGQGPDGDPPAGAVVVEAGAEGVVLTLVRTDQRR